LSVSFGGADTTSGGASVGLHLSRGDLSYASCAFSRAISACFFAS
jgi:hypothetical protein